MKKTTFLVIFALLAMLGQANPATAEDAAMVVDATGRPAIYDSGDRKDQSLMLMDFLALGDRIRLGADTRLVLNYFASGTREEIQGPGVIVIGQASSQKTGAKVVQSDKVDYIPPQSTVTGDDIQRAGVVALRDTQQAEQVVFPLGSDLTAVRDTPHLLRWRQVPGANRYQLTLTETNGQVLFETLTDHTDYCLQRSDLGRGVELRWKVNALDGAQVLARGGGRFYLLRPADLSQVDQVEKYIKDSFDDNSTEAKIALAMLYKKYQLNDDARSLLLDLRKDHPRNTNIIRQIKELRQNYKP